MSNIRSLLELLTKRMDNMDQAGTNGCSFDMDETMNRLNATVISTIDRLSEVT